MKTETAPKPAEHVIERIINEADEVARKDPAKAVALAIGAGVVLNILPLRFLVTSTAAVTLTLLRPTLLTLGLIKAFELCNSATHHHE